MADKTAEELLAELGIEVEAASPSPVSAHDERVIAGFEDIQRFVDEQGRVPQHGESRDIFERMYAVRLDRLRAMPEAVALLTPLDRQGLLQSGGGPAEEAAGDAAALLAQLGIDPVAENDITSLKHVRPTAERKAADEIANRSRCEDFEIFKPLFEKVRRELDGGVRQTRPFEVKAEIDAGRFFIVGGQMAYVAEKGEEFTQEYGDRDARLRVIYDNGTESNVLMRSLQRALNKDEAGRRITEPGAGPLFADTSEE
ncbi:MAG TPA: GIY-YIG nuclease family protein, partial [Hyphomonas sp.]|nr:GIY-YIG nuclease family protein [Hyphomonas sp.]